MYYYCLIFIGVITISVTHSQNVEKRVVEYFKSDGVANCRNEWNKHRKAFENAMSLALQDSIGMPAMNVYVKKSNDLLSRGYFHDDGFVKLILSDLNLKEIPRFWKPAVSFSLASNVIKMKALVSKMIVHAEYVLLRNRSDIIYEAKYQNDSKTSPFLFEQVQPMGKIAITLDRCILSGFMMVKLSGASIDLGHDSLKLHKCRYTVEIYKLGLGSPPVIAKYFPIGDGLGLHHLVMQPIYTELIPKLQATIFSYINTIDIFGTNLQLLTFLYRSHKLFPFVGTKVCAPYGYFYSQQQDAIFQMTSRYLEEIVRNLNKLTIEKNNGVLELKDQINFIWDDTIPRVNGKVSHLRLSDLVVTGLDTLYSAHTGGPYKINDLQIGEEIRFNSIQIRGHVMLISGPGIRKNYHEFACELSDVDFDIAIKVYLMPKRDGEMKIGLGTKLSKLELTRIRGMVFSIPGLVFATLEPIITGYLLKEVPNQLIQHIKQIFNQAIPVAKISTDSDDTKETTPSSYSDSAENDITGWKSKGKNNTVDKIVYKTAGFFKKSSRIPKLKKPGKVVKLAKRARPGKLAIKHSKNIDHKTDVM